MLDHLKVWMFTCTSHHPSAIPVGSVLVSLQGTANDENSALQALQRAELLSISFPGQLTGTMLQGKCRGNSIISDTCSFVFHPSQDSGILGELTAK